MCACMLVCVLLHLFVQLTSYPMMTLGGHRLIKIIELFHNVCTYADGAVIFRGNLKCILCNLTKVKK